MIESFTPNLEIRAEQIECKAELPGDPVPWARAGQGRLGQSYTVEKQRAHADALGWAMLQARKRRHPLTVPFGLWVTFYRANRRHCDIDNLLKLVLDAGQGVLWANDSQVDLVIARVIVNHELPRTELVAFRREPAAETSTAGVP